MQWSGLRGVITIRGCSFPLPLFLLWVPVPMRPRKLYRGWLRWGLLLISVGCSQRVDSTAPQEAPEPNTSHVASNLAESFAVEAELGEELRSVPLARRLESSGKFTRLDASATGIDFVCRLDPEHPLRRIFYSGYVCGGVAIGDVDNDGRADVFLVSGAEQNRLFRQVDDWKFEDVTSRAGVGGGDAWGAGAALIDIDNDGDLDIYVCNYDSPNQLFINQGDLRFVEAAAAWGLDLVDASLFPAFADIDRDGDLDLYLLTNRYRRAGGRPNQPPFRMVDEKPVVLPEFEKYYTIQERSPGKFGIDDYGREDYLFVNNGQGRFEDRTRESGIKGHGDGLSATWFDYDADGWLDLYVCNDFDAPDRLYRNNGDGSFTNRLLGVVPHTAWSSMGSDAGDINNDGLMDLFVLDMSGTNHFKQKTTMGAMNNARIEAVAGPPPQIMRNALLLNAGAGRFMEIAYLAGLADSDWSWAAKLADLDCDGRLDAYITNGVVRNFNDSDVPFSTSMLIGQTEWDIYKHTSPRREQNLAFRNAGDFQFEDVSARWGLDHVGISYGAAWGDLDNDGDLDLIVANVDEPVSVFRNDIGSSNDANRATFRLVGRQSNRYGLGARIELQTTSGNQVRELSPMTGFLSCNQPHAQFGLASDTQIERVTIAWPSGRVQTFDRLPANHHFIVREPARDDVRTAHMAGEDRAAPAPMYAPVTELPSIVHQEDRFDDFALQPLLPNKLSQFGPGMAWGDVDSDGDDDLFVGGGAGQAGSLWINLGRGQFEPRDVAAFATDADREDLGCLFLDANGDGALDLYVVSGGIVIPAHTDRLYLNDGSGNFTNASDRLPGEGHSGSVVVASDFDHDGDLDLFVGTRVVPGHYPLAPKSQLLRNDEGYFVDVGNSLAPELVQAGMVTGAVWSDVNDDGWDDLLVTYEWGPVRVFVNQQGKLSEATEQWGLAQHTGWWNGIASGDLDNDGDIDFVVTNFGLNTKYHASQDKPALLYYGDFDKSGRMRLIEAEFEDEVLFPVRGRSCSTRAMPFLADKFNSYRDFALADLSQIYTDACLADSHRFAATILESCVLLNEGTRFRVEPLPRLAQNSPGFGAVLLDSNSDGFLDVYLAQNFFGPQLETGRMDGGVSLLMLGRGDGRFSVVWPAESGLLATEDAKSVALVDLNDDARPDVVVANNQGPLQAFVRSNKDGFDASAGHVSTGEAFEVRLVGPPKNPTGIGAKVRVTLNDGSRLIREIQAGSGYLTQSPPSAFIAVPTGVRVDRIEIVWPDGEVQLLEREADRRKYLVRR